MRNWLLCTLSLIFCTHLVIVAGDQTVKQTAGAQKEVDAQPISNQHSFEVDAHYPQDVKKEDAHQRKIINIMATISEE